MPEPVEDGDFVDGDTFEEQEPSPGARPSDSGPAFEAEEKFEDQDVGDGRPASEEQAAPGTRDGIIDETPKPAPSRPPGRTVSVPEMPSREAGPSPGPAPAATMTRPSALLPPARPPTKPPAPPKPPLKSLPPEKRMELRETLMKNAFWWLFGLGVADLVVWWVPLLWTNLWMNFGMCIANLVVIVAVLVTAQPHLDVGRAEMSEYERKRASGVLKGLMIIMLVPIHEVLGWLPLGYYSPSWSSYGWLGLLNPAAMLLGAMVVAFNVQRSRERMGYFAIWRNGVIILVLAPCFALIQLAVPILVYPEWFHQTVGLMGGTVMVIAFVLKRQRDRQLSELETAMRRGDELAARGQLEQAIDQYDTAINMAHTLFSHLIFNPDSPSMSVRVPPAYSEPWFRKGRVLVRRGRPDKALAIFEMIIEMDPSNQIALLNASEVMVAMGDFKGALAAVDRVLRIVPGHPDALRMKTAIEEAARKAAEDEERAQAAETVFVSAPARPPPVAPAEGEFLDA